jgi:magnesium-transporting ATPase (P-type)
MKKPRRYTHDTLLYESFYVSIINSLFVALAPLGIFIFLAAVEDYPMNKGFWLSTLSMAQMIFAVSFFVNFFYYVYFIRARKLFNYLLAVIVSCSIIFALYYGDYQDLLNDEYNGVVLLSWFSLLVMILIGHKTGWLGNKDAKYERESWMYRHDMLDGEEDGYEKADLAKDYIRDHVYIDHHDENAPDEPVKSVDPEQDPKRAARLMT